MGGGEVRYQNIYIAKERESVAMHRLKNADQLARSLEKYLLSGGEDKTLVGDFIPGSKEEIYFKSL